MRDGKDVQKELTITKKHRPSVDDINFQFSILNPQKPNP